MLLCKGAGCVADWGFVLDWLKPLCPLDFSPYKGRQTSFYPLSYTMKDIVSMWVQWSGKWVQGWLLLDRVNPDFVCFEAWKILRALQSNDNPIGNYISSIIDNGNFMSDEFMVKVFDLFLYSLKPGKQLLIDGFPRKIPQMHGFLERMKANNREFIAVLIDLDIDIAIERIQHRRMCKPCWAILNTKLDDCLTCPKCKSTDIYQRTDDQTLESIKSRIAIYTNETQPVIDYFETLGVVKHVNGNQDIESVFADILKIIKE